MSILQAKWYYYLLLGLIDVEANYLGKFVIRMVGSGNGQKGTFSVHIKMGQSKFHVPQNCKYS